MRRSLPALLLLALLCCLFPLYALAGSAGLSGTAWVDDGSGLYSAGSRPLAKVSVALYRLDDSGNESQVKRVSTDQDGAYSFSGLDAGTYRLRASLPAEYQFIAPKTGGSIMLPASGGDSFSMPIALTEGQQKTDMHIGASKGGCFIKAIVFEDLNQNGGRSVNETLLRGVEVTLLYEMDGELVEIASVRSDQDGDATFWKLTPGT